MIYLHESYVSKLGFDLGTPKFAVDTLPTVMVSGKHCYAIVDILGPIVNN